MLILPLGHTTSLHLPTCEGAEVLKVDAWHHGAVSAAVMTLRSEGRFTLNLTTERPRIYVVLEHIGTPLRISAQLGSQQGAVGAVLAPSVGSVSAVPAGLNVQAHGQNTQLLRLLIVEFAARDMAVPGGADTVDVAQAFAVPRLMADNPRILALSKLLTDDMTALDKAYGAGLCFAMLTAIRSAQVAVGEVKAKRGGLAPWQLRRVTEYLTQHLTAEVDLDTMATMVGLSRWYFCRAFKASTGLPPRRWQINARIAKGKELMLSGQMSLAEVALMSGFADQAHFSHAFAKMEKQSPRAWQRAQHA
jgi:AraC-like DNA-binding protein